MQHYVINVVSDLQQGGGTPVSFTNKTPMTLVGYLIVDDPQETAQTPNDDLVKLYAWSTKWLVNFNPQKTETMTISQN